MVNVKRYMNEKDLFITEYPSIGDFITDINSRPNNKFFKDRNSSQRKETTDNWYATPDYQRAMYMVNHGWDEAASKMAQKVKLTMASSSPVRTSRPQFGVVGSQASVPRYLQGIPTNMISRNMTYSKQKVVTITRGISYNWTWSTERMMAEGIKALQLIQSLETAGKRVRLNVMWAISCRNHHTVCKVCVKKPDERLNLSKMAFALAHPSMLRRFFFKWLETDTFTKYDMGDGYGSPARRDIKERSMSENEYYIPEEIEDLNELIEKLQAGK